MNIKEGTNEHLQNTGVKMKIFEMDKKRFFPI